MPCWARRLSRRAFEVFRLGTAMGGCRVYRNALRRDRAARSDHPSASSRVGSIASRKRRSWRDDDERAVVAVERHLELLDRLEVEVVRRLVEEQQVDAARLELREVRPRPLARRQRRRTRGRRGRRRARTSRAAFAQSTGVETGRPRRTRRAAGTVAVLVALLPDRADHGCAGRSLALACDRAASSPRSTAEQRRLPAPVAAGHRQPLPRREVEVDRAEREARRARRPRRETRDTSLGRASPPLQAELELPRLERLLAAARSARAAAPPGAPSSSARASRAGRAHAPRPAARLRSALGEERARARAAAPAPPRSGAYAPHARGVARGRVLRPAARPLAHAAAARLDLGDPGHRAVEEGAIVRDDDERRRGARRRTARAARARRSRDRSSARRAGARRSATAGSPRARAAPTRRPRAARPAGRAPPASPSSARTVAARLSRSPPPSARKRSSASA